MFEKYADQVRLLIRMLPIVAGEHVFALKGGTAINFFIRNMPRLSVDIDLTYLQPKALKRRWPTSMKHWNELR